MNVDETKSELNVVTLESLIVTERVTKAVRANIKNNILKADDLPFHLHTDSIITKKRNQHTVEKFTYKTD